MSDFDLDFGQGQGPGESSLNGNNDYSNHLIPEFNPDFTFEGTPSELEDMFNKFPNDDDIDDFSGFSVDPHQEAGVKEAQEAFQAELESMNQAQNRVTAVMQGPSISHDYTVDDPTIANPQPYINLPQLDLNLAQPNFNVPEATLEDNTAGEVSYPFTHPYFNFDQTNIDAPEVTLGNNTTDNVTPDDPAPVYAEVNGVLRKLRPDESVHPVFGVIRKVGPGQAYDAATGVITTVTTPEPPMNTAPLSLQQAYAPSVQSTQYGKRPLEYPADVPTASKKQKTYGPADFMNNMNATASGTDLSTSSSASISRTASPVLPPPMAVQPLDQTTKKRFMVRTCVCSAPAKIPRPKNPFIIYRAEFGRIQKTGARPKAKGNGKNELTISHDAGESWREIGPEGRAPYIARAEEEKRQHALLHPDYKYNPRKDKTNEQFGNQTCTCGAYQANLAAVREGLGEPRGLQEYAPQAYPSAPEQAPAPAAQMVQPVQPVAVPDEMPDFGLPSAYQNDEARRAWLKHKHNHAAAGSEDNEEPVAKRRSPRTTVAPKNYTEPEIDDNFESAVMDYPEYTANKESSEVVNNPIEIDDNENDFGDLFGDDDEDAAGEPSTPTSNTGLALPTDSQKIAAYYANMTKDSDDDEVHVASRRTSPRQSVAKKGTGRKTILDNIEEAENASGRSTRSTRSSKSLKSPKSTRSSRSTRSSAK